MTKVLSLKLKGEIFEETETLTRRFRVPRNAYINQALHFYNAFNRRKWLRKKLGQESLLARADSLEVLGEMERLEEEGLE